MTIEINLEKFFKTCKYICIGGWQGFVDLCKEGYKNFHDFLDQDKDVGDMGLSFLITSLVCAIIWLILMLIAGFGLIIFLGKEGVNTFESIITYLAYFLAIPPFCMFLRILKSTVINLKEFGEEIEEKSKKRKK